MSHGTCMLFLIISALSGTVLCERRNLDSNSETDKKCKCGISNEEQDSSKPIWRIIEGVNVQPGNKYPWMVTLKDPSGKLLCGGAIISPNFILSAAHCSLVANITYQVSKRQCITKQRKTVSCFKKPEEIIIHLLGESPSSEKQVGLKRILSHPGYTAHRTPNDIALYKLEKRINCNGYERPICLPTPGMEEVGQDVIIAGWGATDSSLKTPKDGILREGSVNIVSSKFCSRGLILEDKFVCATGEDQGSCSGDSGAPMFANFNDVYHILGVTSKHSSVTCDPKMPVTYSKVSSFLRWIRKHVTV